VVLKYSEKNNNTLANAMARALNEDFEKLAKTKCKCGCFNCSCGKAKNNGKCPCNCKSCKKTKVAELEDISYTILRSADLLDKVGHYDAALSLSYALKKLAENGCNCPDCPDEIEDIDSKEDLVYVISKALFDISDTLDKLGHFDVSDNVDTALKSLSGKKCDCGGSCCNGNS